MDAPNVRQYEVEARSTDTFGRVLCSARTNHFIVDGPVQNGCPGEAMTPPEAFLAGVAACGIELLQVIGRELGIVVHSAQLHIEGIVDRSRPVRPDVTLFNEVRLRFDVRGVSQAQANDLVDRFKKR
jgi:uncharacterized OsmC-like protein